MNSFLFSSTETEADEPQPIQRFAHCTLSFDCFFKYNQNSFEVHLFPSDNDLPKSKIFDLMYKSIVVSGSSTPPSSRTSTPSNSGIDLHLAFDPQVGRSDRSEFRYNFPEF